MVFSASENLRCKTAQLCVACWIDELELLASRERASLHCPRRYSFRALLCDWIAMGCDPISRVDDHADREFETRITLQGDHTDA